MTYADYFPDLADCREVIDLDWYFSTSEVLENTYKFVEIIKNYDKDKKICVFGDYDTDGIMATSIMVYALRTCGFKKVYFSIPNRLKHGYGLGEYFWTDDHFKYARESDLLITVDTGISSKEYVKRLKSEGKDVIITDHHIPENDVPEDVLVIDPKYGNNKYTDICGAVVALKLCYALLNELNLLDSALVDSMVSLAGVAAIADMTSMLGENRKLVNLTLSMIDCVKERALEASGKLDSNDPLYPLFQLIKNFGGYSFLNNDKYSTDNLISTTIVPTINSVSRVDGDVSLPVLCILNSFNGVYYRSYTPKNIERKNLTNKILEDFMFNNAYGSQVFVFDKDKYDFDIRGLMSLIASRVSNKYKQVAIIGRELENIYDLSCRSVRGYNLYEALRRISVDHPELEIDMGGHSQALGLRIKKSPENLDILREAIDLDFEKQFDNSIYGDEDDYVIEFTDMELLNILRGYAPYGTDFKPVEFLYSGVVKSYNDRTRMIEIGDYTFKLGFDAELPEDFESLSVVFEAIFDGEIPTLRINKVV